MADPNIIHVTAQHYQGANLQYNKATGDLTPTEMVDAVSLGVNGNASKKDLDNIRQKLAGMNGGVPQSVLDRLSQTKSGANGATGLPNGYSRGVYTQAHGAADVREGFKGDLVTQRQQMLKGLGYDLGATGKTKDGVDGYWGANTQKAWNQYLSDTNQSPDRGAKNIASDAENRTKYTNETPTNVAKNLTAEMNNGETHAVTQGMTSLTNQQMKAVDGQMKAQTGKGLADTIADMKEDNINGNVGDYKDLMTKMAQGNKNEGADAGATNKVVDQYAKDLIGARATAPMFSGWPLLGTDRQKINDVFATASGAQLKELDSRFKAGIKQPDGSVVKYADGLSGYLADQTSDGSQREALLAKMNGPLR